MDKNLKTETFCLIRLHTSDEKSIASIFLDTLFILLIDEVFIAMGIFSFVSIFFPVQLRSFLQRFHKSLIQHIRIEKKYKQYICVDGKTRGIIFFCRKNRKCSRSWLTWTYTDNMSIESAFNLSSNAETIVWFKRS